MTIPYRDLHTLPEDERIKLIGQKATEGNRVAVLLEKDEPAKVARYIQKVVEQFPSVMHIETIPGPAPSVVAVKFGPKH